MLRSFSWRHPAIWLFAAILAVVLAASAMISFAWPYLKYDEIHRAAASHLDKVTVEGFAYVGEDGADPGALSRFWIRREVVSDPGSAVRYDGHPLRLDMPGRDSLPQSRDERDIGWLSWPGDAMPCSLTASQVHNLMPGVLPSEISQADRVAINEAKVSLIRVDVACGGG